MQRCSAISTKLAAGAGRVGVEGGARRQRLAMRVRRTMRACSAIAQGAMHRAVWTGGM